MYQRYVKRLLDIILSLAATILLAIPMGIIALWIKADSPGPVFFKQRRVGKGKTHFNILKFRTMRGDTPHDVPAVHFCARRALMSCPRSTTFWPGR